MSLRLVASACREWKKGVKTYDAKILPADVLDVLRLWSDVSHNELEQTTVAKRSVRGVLENVVSNSRGARVV
jgi:hypothetical protein